MTNELIDTFRIAASVALFVFFAFLAVLGGLGVIGIVFRLVTKLQTWFYWRELKQRKGKNEINNIQS